MLFLAGKEQELLQGRQPVSRSELVPALLVENVPARLGKYFPYAISPLEIHTSEIEGRVVLSNVLLEFEVHLESIVTIQIAAGTGI